MKKLTNLSGRRIGPIILSIVFCLLTSLTSCKKFIEIAPPSNSINSANVYSTDATASAVLTGIYTNLSSSNRNGFMSFGSGLSLVGLYTSLSADELKLFSGSNNLQLLAYYRNSLTSSVTGGTDFWNYIYPLIYKINSAIEGLNTTNSLTPSVKKQLLGEAYFMRAFCYFYLTNLYGDVPLILKSDYTANAEANRAPKNQVYAQIISDTNLAQSMLNENYYKGDILNFYPSGSEERVRPNRSTALALLARANLFKGEWVNAEKNASSIINNTTLYDLSPLSGVFLKNSKETIWSIQPVGTGTQANTGEGALFILPPTGPSTTFPVYLSGNLINSFEIGDQRLIQWTRNITISGVTYNYAYKYKTGAVSTASPTEYEIVFRLSEQYLIRAEARAMQNNLIGAADDLNVVRKRAGLTNALANTQSTLLNAIYHERQIELFTEWGHRWFDLKRTNNVDIIMPAVCTQKGSTWSSNWALYPIPATEIQRDPNLIQNIGY